jgi:ubiquitin related modifier 1
MICIHLFSRKTNLVFSGGVETLFGNVRDLDIEIPSDLGDGSPKMKHLLPWIKDNLLKERPDLFLQENTM